MRIRYGLLMVALVTTGCQQTKPTVPVPQVVTVTVTKYVPVPKEFTEHCPIAEPTNRTVKEAVRVAKSRRTSLENCNSQLDKIRGLPVSPEQKP